MKIKKIGLLILQLLLVFGLNAQNQTKVTTANLNLRTDPNTSSEILTLIPKGTEVKIDKDCDCTWILVSYDGKIGYVYSKYLKIQKSNNTNYNQHNNTSEKHYTNKGEQKVQSSTYYNSSPAGATALCRDGAYSFSRNRRGTCSRHGGVARWL
jgi:uncharacterized protein YgiM (DUF1202 family)